jgi:hypothetical protein
MRGNEEAARTEIFSTISVGSRQMVGPSAPFQYGIDRVLSEHVAQT